MDIYIWKKDYEFIHNQKADFTKKEKNLSIILDQCSPSLKSQLEGTKKIKKHAKK